MPVEIVGLLATLFIAVGNTIYEAYADRHERFKFWKAIVVLFLLSISGGASYKAMTDDKEASANETTARQKFEIKVGKGTEEIKREVGEGTEEVVKRLTVLLEALDAAEERIKVADISLSKGLEKSLEKLSNLDSDVDNLSSDLQLSQKEISAESDKVKDQLSGLNSDVLAWCGIQDKSMRSR